MAHIKTREQARQFGIDFQRWSSNKDLSYREIHHFQNKLIKIAQKFGLIEEFKENGLI